MQTLETPPINPDTEDPIDPRRKALIEGTPADTFESRQIQLVGDKCKRDNHTDNITASMLRATTGEWADPDHPNTSYARKLRDFVSDPDFKIHQRFDKHYGNITIEDLEYYMQTGQIPD